MSGVDGWVGRWVRGWGGWRPPTALLIPPGLIIRPERHRGRQGCALRGVSANNLYVVSPRRERDTILMPQQARLALSRLATNVKPGPGPRAPTQGPGSCLNFATLPYPEHAAHTPVTLLANTNCKAAQWQKRRRSPRIGDHVLLLITTKRRRDVLGKTLKGGRAPDREWHIGALQFLQ